MENPFVFIGTQQVLWLGSYAFFSTSVMSMRMFTYSRVL